MKVSNPFWKERLAGRMPEELAREIDIFDTELELKRTGKIDDRVFNETRLRRGIYGQRYDNGRRHDGKAVQRLAYPSGERTKGPNTLWDAPGMQRIKVPYGGLGAAQLEEMAGRCGWCGLLWCGGPEPLLDRRGNRTGEVEAGTGRGPHLKPSDR